MKIKILLLSAITLFSHMSVSEVTAQSVEAVEDAEAVVDGGQFGDGKDIENTDQDEFAVTFLADVIAEYAGLKIWNHGEGVFLLVHDGEAPFAELFFDESETFGMCLPRVAAVEGLAAAEFDGFRRVDGAQVADQAADACEIGAKGDGHQRNASATGEFDGQCVESAAREFADAGGLGEDHDRAAAFQTFGALLHNLFEVLAGVFACHFNGLEGAQDIAEVGVVEQALFEDDADRGEGGHAAGEDHGFDRAHVVCGPHDGHAEVGCLLETLERDGSSCILDGFERFGCRLHPTLLVHLAFACGATGANDQPHDFQVVAEAGEASARGALPLCSAVASGGQDLLYDVLLKIGHASDVSSTREELNVLLRAHPSGVTQWTGVLSRGAKYRWSHECMPAVCLVGIAVAIESASRLEHALVSGARKQQAVPARVP